MVPLGGPLDGDPPQRAIQCPCGLYPLEGGEGGFTGRGEPVDPLPTVAGMRGRENRRVGEPSAAAMTWSSAVTIRDVVSAPRIAVAIKALAAHRVSRGGSRSLTARPNRAPL